jgi:hypothetical protein
MTKPKRVSIGFKADRVEDGDFIAWWESLPPGERSDGLRAKFREAHWGLPSTTTDPTRTIGVESVGELVTEVRALRTEVGALSKLVGTLLTQIAAGQSAYSSVDRVQPAIDEATAERRRKNLSRAKW